MVITTTKLLKNTQHTIYHGMYFTGWLIGSDHERMLILSATFTREGQTTVHVGGSARLIIVAPSCCRVLLRWWGSDGCSPSAAVLALEGNLFIALLIRRSTTSFAQSTLGVIARRTGIVMIQASAIFKELPKGKSRQRWVVWALLQYAWLINTIIFTIDIWSARWLHINGDIAFGGGTLQNVHISGCFFLL